MRARLYRSKDACPLRLFARSAGVQQLRPVLEMHRVEVQPPSAPNETMTLEYRHDLKRDPIPVYRTPPALLACQSQ